MAESMAASGGFSYDREELEQICVPALCAWLKHHCMGFPEGHPLRRQRVNGLILADADFLGTVMHSFDPSALPLGPGGSSPAPGAVAKCLSSVIMDQGQGNMQAASVVESCLSTNDLEPLEDVVRLWQFVLAYAVLCCDEHKEQRIKALQALQPEHQQVLITFIQFVESQMDDYVAEPDTVDAPQQLDVSGEGSGGIEFTPKADRSERISMSLCDSEQEGGNPVLQCAASMDQEECYKNLCEAQKENEILKGQVAELWKKVECSEKARRRTLVAEHKVLDSEFETMEEAWQLQKDLKKMSERLAEAQGAAEAGRIAVEENKNLRDELAILQSKGGSALMQRESAKLQLAQERAEKAKEYKLELQQCKDALKKEKSENADLRSAVAMHQKRKNEMEWFQRQTQQCERKVEAAEADLKKAKENLRKRDAECKRITEEKLVLQNRVDDLKAENELLEFRAHGTADENDRIEELFTDELREKMQSLEQRNELLEQQITEEGAQRQAALVGENKVLQNGKTHWMERAQQAEEQVSAKEETLRRTMSRIEENERVHQQRVTELEASLATEQQSLNSLEREFECKSADLSAQALELEAAQRARAQLEAELAQAQEQLLDLSDYKEKVDELENELETQGRVKSLYEKNLSTMGEELKGSSDENAMLKDERGDQQRQLLLARYRVEEHVRLQKRCGADIESIERQYSELLARFNEVQKNLSQEQQVSEALRLRLSDSEMYGSTLYAAMERSAPGELSILSRDVALMRGDEPPSRLRAEIDRLQKELTGTKIRWAEETRELAQTKEKLRNVGQEVLARESELLSLTNVPVSGQLTGSNECERRTPLAERNSLPSEQQALGQRSGILKKSKTADLMQGSPSKVARRGNMQPWSAADLRAPQGAPAAGARPGLGAPRTSGALRAKREECTQQ